MCVYIYIIYIYKYIYIYIYIHICVCVCVCVYVCVCVCVRVHTHILRDKLHIQEGDGDHHRAREVPAWISYLGGGGQTKGGAKTK